MEYLKTTKFIGLDVHRNSISLAVADGGPDGEVRLYDLPLGLCTS